jgi:hypothetical protein
MTGLEAYVFTLVGGLVVGSVITHLITKLNAKKKRSVEPNWKLKYSKEALKNYALENPVEWLDEDTAWANQILDDLKLSAAKKRMNDVFEKTLGGE